MSDRARRAWITLTVTGTVLLIAGVLTALAGLALAPGGRHGTPAAVVAGQALICCGLACGGGLLAAAALGLPGERRRVIRRVTGRLAVSRRGLPVPRWQPTLRTHRPAGPAALRGPRRAGPASGHGETSQDWIRSLRPGGPAG